VLGADVSVDATDTYSMPSSESQITSFGAEMPPTGFTQTFPGADVKIVNVCGDDRPPEGFETAILLLPGEAILLAGMMAVIRVEFTHNDEMVTPFHSTVAALSKFEPFSVKPTAEAPTVALVGEMEVNEGTSLLVPPPPALPLPLVPPDVGAPLEFPPPQLIRNQTTKVIRAKGHERRIDTFPLIGRQNFTHTPSKVKV
jgi:hypothetical protein